MSDLQDLLGIIGGAGNAAGVQGDGPGGLNAMQRMALPAQQQGAYGQQTALAQLAQDPNFQGMAPADQQAKLLQATGDPAVAQKVSALSQLAKMNTGNPQQFINQGVQNGNIEPKDALTALANPMLQTGSSGPAQPNTPGAPTAPNGAGTAPQQSAVGGLNPEGPDDQRNYAFLATVPPAFQGIIKGISEGDEHAGAIARGNPNATYILNAAYKFDPTLTQPGAGPDSRIKTNVAFGAGGQQGLTRAAINTAIQHTAQLAAATYDLHNNQGPIGNKIGNLWNQEVKGQDAGSNFDSVADRLAPELAKVSAGNGVAADNEIKRQRDGLQKNGSPQQQYGALSNIMELVANKSKELGNTYQSTMGRPIKMITPENQQHLNDIQRLADLGKQGKQRGLEAQQIVQRLHNVETPAPTPNLPDAPSAAQQNQQTPKFTEGQLVTNNRTGQKAVIKNGIPVPIGGQ